MPAADRRPTGPLGALSGLIRSLGADGAARNAAVALDERHRQQIEVEGQLASIRRRRFVSDVA